MRKTTGFRKSIVKVSSMEEMNSIIDYAKKCSAIRYNSWEKREKGDSCQIFSFIQERERYYCITTRFYKGSKGKVKTFEFDKYGEEVQEQTYGATVYATLQRYYHAPEFTEDEYVKKVLGWNEDSKSFTVGPPILIYHNQKHNRTRQRMWCYDLNSAYSAQMLGEIPDTSSYDVERFVEEGEVGFFITDRIRLVEAGGYANFIFKLMKSPYKEFVAKYYEEKKNATTQQEKKKAKDTLLYGVGYYQRKNPFLRAYIVERCNNYIKSLMDENTMICNTDSIFSTVERKDLDIGPEIGQFKLEFEGPVAYIGDNYQKGNEAPHCRGVIRKLFKPGFDILKDRMPKATRSSGVFKVNLLTDMLEVTDNGI